MTVMVADVETHARQRALLTRLLELTQAQQQALDTGDLAALNAISGQRAQLVGAAAPYIPPQCPWDLALAPLAREVQETSERLQRDLRATQAAILRDLQALQKREQVVQYLPAAGRKSRLAWKG